MISDWKDFFGPIMDKPYAKSISSFLDEEYQTQSIYPPRELIFNAFQLTSPKDLKVVIIGQDPYHNPGQAMGLSFSVPKGISLPPSLVNIYKEIQNDLGVEMDFASGDLSCWARQGVLLLNAYLTVRENEPLSHARKEYSAFMKDAISYIETLNQTVVYLLWGGFAKKHEKYITNPKHVVLSATHPSPLGANKGGWFHMHLFSKTNEILKEGGITPINWSNK